MLGPFSIYYCDEFCYIFCRDRKTTRGPNIIQYITVIFHLLNFSCHCYYSMQKSYKKNILLHCNKKGDAKTKTLERVTSNTRNVKSNNVEWFRDHYLTMINIGMWTLFVWMCTHCILYCVQCTVYSVLCTLCILYQCTVYSVLLNFDPLSFGNVKMFLT